MSDTIIGMSWARNESDIIEEVIIDALPKVDTLFIADGKSTDGTWEIIQSLQKRYPDKIEHIQQEDETNDKAQRTSLLNKIRARYKPENSWVQLLESDIFILDTDVRELVRKNSDKIAISWQTLNACRKTGTWKEVDTYPTWKMPIKQLMPYAHWMEVMLYTFRPLPALYYGPDIWRPWPKGWTKYTNEPIEIKRKEIDSPLLLHAGYRGPTHFYNKYKSMGRFHKKYTQWRLKHVQSVEDTVYFFNGTWNGDCFEATRKGWTEWLSSRRHSEQR